MGDQKQTESVTGYQVSNMVTVKIRDTEKISEIIDAAVGGGETTSVSTASGSPWKTRPSIMKKPARKP